MIPVSQDIERIIDILCEIAFAMQRDGKFAGAVPSEWLKTKMPGEPLEDHVKVAHQTQLIDLTPEKNLRFSHQILQEYFAAVALKKEWQEGKNLGAYFKDYRWEDTILVCAGIVKDTEKFISEIWSPGDNSPPEAFWLATKAVGSSGRRVSSEYYGTLLQEAKKDLGLTEAPKVIGYSPTVLAVDTVKALSYIDDNETTELLKLALVKHEGWIRELCIQFLGSSRNPSALSLLRSALSKVNSFSDLLLAAPYFDRRVWLMIVANHTFSFKNEFEEIRHFLKGKRQWPRLNWLDILDLGVVLDVILFSLVLIFVQDMPTTVNLYIQCSRLLSLAILLILICFYISRVSKIMRSKKDSVTSLQLLRDELTWRRLLLLVPIFALWFFPGEMLLLSQILFIYTWLLIDAIVLMLRIKSPRGLAILLYDRGLIAIFAGVMIFLGALFPPPIRDIALGFLFPNITSAPESVLTYAILFLIQPVIYQAFLLLSLLIVFASIVVYFKTYLAYWHLRQYRTASVQRGKLEAVQRIMDIALNPSELPQIRIKAFKNLRLVESTFYHLQSYRLEDLENLIDNEGNPDLRRELERTVYELRAYIREKNREHSEEKYILLPTNRRKIYHQKKHYQAILDYLNRAIASDKKDDWAIAHRGETYLEMERYEEALADFDRAIALDEKDDWAIAHRGETYLKMKRYEEALADFDRAIALDESNDWYRYRRALVYFVAGRIDDYESDLRVAIELVQTSLPNAPNDWLMNFNLALYKLAAGHADAEVLYYQLASTCSLVPILQEAIEDLDEFLTIQPFQESMQRVNMRLRARVNELQSFSKF